MMVKLLLSPMVVAAMGQTLLFVLAREAELPDGTCSVKELIAAQRKAPVTGYVLRLYTCALGAVDDLLQLPLNGKLIGDGQRKSAEHQLICEAVLPRYQPEQNWLGVYAKETGDQSTYRCVDRFALQNSNNETCWFYPTHDGIYLGWEQDLELLLLPGSVVDPSQELMASPYDRERISLLWSLLKDDESLTSVGLTYGGQRVEWSPQVIKKAPQATWSCFTVDSQASPSLVVLTQQCLQAQ
jgi:hypothetical protein